MLEYIPEILDDPKIVDYYSAWGNIPTILKDIILRFNIRQNIALEFGVGGGYSTSALANYFEKVIGIDHFIWEPGGIEKVKETLKDYNNIFLYQNRWEEFILLNDNNYDLIHIDIEHNFADTFNCGEWSVCHSDCVIFHDTESFYEVKKACEALSKKYDLKFYNYQHDCGLGILVK